MSEYWNNTLCAFKIGLSRTVFLCVHSKLETLRLFYMFISWSNSNYINDLFHKHIILKKNSHSQLNDTADVRFLSQKYSIIEGYFL